MSFYDRKSIDERYRIQGSVTLRIKTLLGGRGVRQAESVPARVVKANIPVSEKQ